MGNVKGEDALAFQERIMEYFGGLQQRIVEALRADDTIA